MSDKKKNNPANVNPDAIDLEKAADAVENATDEAAQQAEDAVAKVEEQVDAAVEAAKEDIKEEAKGAKENIRKASKTNNSKLAQVLHLKQLRYGSLSIVLTVIVIIAVMALNWVVGLVENRFALTVDLSYNQRFSISTQTRDIVSALDQDVKIYTLLQENSNTTLSEMLTEMLQRYQALGHIQVQNLDIVANPTAAARFQKEGTTLNVNSIIVTNADETKYRIISSSELYDREYGYDSNYNYTITKNDFIGERAVTSAIVYVTATDTPKVFILQGHGEPEYSYLTSLTSALTTQNYDPVALNLADSTVEMNKGDVLMVIGPTSDLSDTEYDILLKFLQDGGRMYFASQFRTTKVESVPNFMALLKFYGLTLNDSLVVEDVSSSGYYYRQQLWLMPQIQLTDSDGNEYVITSGFDSSSYVVLPNCQYITTEEMKQSGQIYTTVLQTSDAAYAKSIVNDDTTIDKQPDDATGPFAIAMSMDKYNYDNPEDSTRIFVVGNAYYLANSDYFNAYDNDKLLYSPMEWLVDRTTTVYVPSKSLGTYTMSIPDNTTYQILTVTVIIAIPVIILLAGFIIWRRRRHL